MIRTSARFIIVILLFVATLAPPEASGGPFRFRRRHRHSQPCCPPPMCVACAPAPPSDGEVTVCPGPVIMEFWDGIGDEAQCVSATYESYICKDPPPHEACFFSGQCRLTARNCDNGIGCFNVPEEEPGSKRHMARKWVLYRYGAAPTNEQIRTYRGYSAEPLGYVWFKVKDKGADAGDLPKKRYARVFWVYPGSNKAEGTGVGVEVAADYGASEAEKGKIREHYGFVKMDVPGLAGKKKILVRFRVTAEPEDNE